jgi:hypothetical protein
MLSLYDSEQQCEAALCGGQEHGLVYGRRLKRYPCQSCGYQPTVTAGTIMQATTFNKFDRRDLGCSCFCFNRLFALAQMTQRFTNAICCCMPCTGRNPMVAEVYG